MVNNWEIEWNSSMIEHGRDLGTMEFIFAKGGTVADMNYVMFDVQNNSWEPLIKAVAERDNSHPDIIRKEAAQQQQEQGALGIPQGFTPGVAVNPQMVVAANPRATKQANRALRSANAGQNVRDGSTGVGDLANAGFYGQAAMQAGKNIMGAGKNTAQGAMGMAGRGLSAAKDMGGRALQAVKDSGMGERMKNFMGAAGRGISDLRHAPAAAKQAFRDSRARREDEDRRNTLEGGLGRGQRELDDAERRYVPGSQNFDTNMDRARGSTSQGLARDFNVNPNTNKKGKATQSVEDAMRDEIKRIGDRRAQPKEGFFASMKRQGDKRRAGNQAQEEGAAYAPSNMATEEPEKVPLPAGPSTDAEQAANADKVPKEGGLPKIDFTQTVDEAPPDTQVGPPTKVEPETATATEQPSFGQRFATEAGMKMGAPSGDRVRGGLDKVYAQHQESPFADRDAAMQAMLQGGIGTKGMTTAGKFSGKSAQAVEAALMEMGFGPAEAKNVAQQAEAGNPEAKEIVEEATSGGRQGLPEINFDPAAEEMKLSSKEHEASWDSVLKGLNVR
jgi:hypothetical protein